MNIPGTVPLPDGMKLEDIEWQDDAKALKALAAIDQANRKRLAKLDRLALHWHKKRAAALADEVARDRQRAALEADAEEMRRAIDQHVADVRRAMDAIAERRNRAKPVNSSQIPA